MIRAQSATDRSASISRLCSRMPKRSSGFRSPWLQLVLSVACVVVYELLLKRGASDIANPESSWSWTGINGLTSPLVWLGIALVVIGLAVIAKPVARLGERL